MKLSGELTKFINDKDVSTQVKLMGMEMALANMLYSICDGESDDFRFETVTNSISNLTTIVEAIHKRYED